MSAYDARAMSVRCPYGAYTTQPVRFPCGVYTTSVRRPYDAPSYMSVVCPWYVPFSPVRCPYGVPLYKLQIYSNLGVSEIKKPSTVVFFLLAAAPLLPREHYRFGSTIASGGGVCWHGCGCHGCSGGGVGGGRGCRVLHSMARPGPGRSNGSPCKSSEGRRVGG